MRLRKSRKKEIEDIEDIVRKNPNSWEYCITMCLKYSNNHYLTMRRLMTEFINVLMPDDLDDLISIFLDRIKEDGKKLIKQERTFLNHIYESNGCSRYNANDLI